MSRTSPFVKTCFSSSLRTYMRCRSFTKRPLISEREQMAGGNFSHRL